MPARAVITPEQLHATPLPAYHKPVDETGRLQNRQRS